MLKNYITPQITITKFSSSEETNNVALSSVQSYYTKSSFTQINKNNRINF